MHPMSSRFLPPVSGSADGTVKLWDAAGSAAQTWADVGSAVTALSVHPLGSLALAAGAAGRWTLLDLAAPGARCLFTSDTAEGVDAGWTCGEFHPDGGLLALGAAGRAIAVWDLKSPGAPVAQLEAAAGVSALAFSADGYRLATAGAAGVQVWDLRKLRCAQEIGAGGGGTAAASATAPAPAAVAFDGSGQYLAIGGAGVEVYTTKKWERVADLTGFPAKGVRAVAFGEGARSVVVGASDHKLRIFG